MLTNALLNVPRRTEHRWRKRWIRSTTSRYRRIGVRITQVTWQMSVVLRPEILHTTPTVNSCFRLISDL